MSMNGVLILFATFPPLPVTQISLLTLRASSALGSKTHCDLRFHSLKYAIWIYIFNKYVCVYVCIYRCIFK